MRFTLPMLGLCALATMGAAAPLLPSATTGGTPIVRVDAERGASEDDTDFLFRLGLMEGHLMIGHELVQAKQPAMALPHFGHPVRELYDDVSGYLTKHRFPAFDKQLARLEASVATAPAGADTEKRYQDMIVTLHKARGLAPAALRASVPEMIKICADTIDAASGEFNEALEQGRIASTVEYHDSRGYLEYTSQQLKSLKEAAHDPKSQGLLARFGDLLAKAEWIVEPLLPDPTPRASVEQFRAIAAQATDLAKDK